MIGSTIISETDKSRLFQIVDDIDKISTLNFINLNALTTLDFCIFLQDTKENWSESEPVYYDESKGIAVIKITEQALTYILNNPLNLSKEQEEDIINLKEFIENNGFSNNYEVTTF